MKQLFYLLLVLGALSSCEECELVTTDIEADMLPNDPDPDTLCDGTFYATYLTLNMEGNIETRNFVSFSKPKSTLFNFNQLESLISSDLQNDQDGYSHSAYNTITDRYAFGYQFGAGITNPLYLADTSPFASTLLTKEFEYAAPVYNNNNLYVIDVFDSGDALDFTISTVNETTGDLTALLIDTTNTKSPMNNQFISSATDGADMIYFLGTTNLISYSISTNNATILDIDAEYSPSNQLVYYGLEYQQDAQRLLAIKERINSPDLVGSLVSITTDGAGTVTPIYDIQSNLNADNDSTIFFGFHSTAFSQCDNTYHITELDELEPDDGIAKSHLIDISLDDSTMTQQQVAGFFYGLEIDEN